MNPQAQAKKVASRPPYEIEVWNRAKGAWQRWNYPPEESLALIDSDVKDHMRSGKLRGQSVRIVDKAGQTVTTYGPDVDRVAATISRLIARVANGEKTALNKTALNPLQILAALFQGAQPYVRDWHRFLRTLLQELPDWPNQWSDVGLYVTEVQPGRTSSEWWPKPNGEEAEVLVAKTVRLVLGAELNLRTFPRTFTQHFRSMVTDIVGFKQAISDLTEDRTSLVLFGKLLRTSLRSALETDPMKASEVALDPVENTAQNMGDTDYWDITYQMGSFEVKQVDSKITGPSLWVEIGGDVQMVATKATLPDDVDEGEGGPPDDGPWV